MSVTTPVTMELQELQDFFKDCGHIVEVKRVDALSTIEDGLQAGTINLCDLRALNFDDIHLWRTGHDRS